MAKIELKDLSISFSAFTAVDKVNLTVNDGEFVVYLGPSGCGKTTTLRSIAGLVEATNGDILFDGERVNDLKPSERNIAMVFQSYALYPHMNVADNMGFALRMEGVRKAERRRRVEEAARILQLEDLLDRLPKQLSGGQRQRVAIARALLKDAPILLLDEATSALDAESETLVQKALTSLMQDRTTLVIAHRLSTIMKMDRIVVMENGTIVEEGDHQDLIKKRL